MNTERWPGRMLGETFGSVSAVAFGSVSAAAFGSVSAAALATYRVALSARARHGSCAPWDREPDDNPLHPCPISPGEPGRRPGGTRSRTGIGTGADLRRSPSSSPRGRPSRAGGGAVCPPRRSPYAYPRISPLPLVPSTVGVAAANLNIRSAGRCRLPCAVRAGAGGARGGWRVGRENLQPFNLV